MSKKADTKRFNLVITQDLYDNVQQIADEQHTSVVDLLRRFIRLGLIAIELQDKPDSALIIREGDVEREIMLL
jgi:hypothetical protein